MHDGIIELKKKLLIIIVVQGKYISVRLINLKINFCIYSSKQQKKKS